MSRVLREKHKHVRQDRPQCIFRKPGQNFPIGAKLYGATSIENGGSNRRIVGAGDVYRPATQVAVSVTSDQYALFRVCVVFVLLLSKVEAEDPSTFDDAPLPDAVHRAGCRWQSLRIVQPQDRFTSLRYHHALHSERAVVHTRDVVADGVDKTL